MTAPGGADVGTTYGRLNDVVDAANTWSTSFRLNTESLRAGTSAESRVDMRRKSYTRVNHLVYAGPKLITC